MKIMNLLPVRIVLIVMLCLAGIASAQSLVGKVIAVKDGDTVVVLDDQKRSHDIRLSGIDAPEKAQPFGQRSKEHLSDTAFGKRVEVVGNKTDKYGRTVGKIMVSGTDANLEQVRAGFAWHYKKYSNEQTVADVAAYAAAENAARASRIGLWRDLSPTPPWDWRQGDKAADAQKMAAQQSGECPCGSTAVCTGPRGGQYCIKPNGKKQY
jgi:micrococcal nuclease